jgi:recombination protein RecA
MTKHKNFLDKIIEEFGEDVLESSRVDVVIPTSSLAINVCTGVGGVPRGRFTHIYGPDASGKTSLGLDISKNALDLGGKVLYLDVEQTLDRDLATAVLGDSWKDDNFIVILPDTAENSFLMAEKAIDSKEFDVIILDSIGALAPAKELEDAFGDAHYALVARALTTFFKRNAYKLRKTDLAFVFLNQVRANIGDFFKDFEIPGGWALKHYASVNISLFPYTSKKEKIKIKVDDKDVFIGNPIKFSITKNKVGVPHRSGRFPIIWGQGIDPLRDIIMFASSLGVLTTRGPYKTFGDDTVGRGEVEIMQNLENNKELLDKIVNECYNVANVVPKAYMKEEKNVGEEN